MNSINYPNYIINVDNVNAIGNTLYLGNNKNVTIGDTNHILNLKSMLHINGNSGEYGNVLTHNGTTIDWEPISINSKGISGSIQYNDGHSGLTGNTLFTYTYQPTVGSTGTIYIRSGNVGVTGVNTQFITELRINHNLITSFPGGTTSWGKIKEIVNDTNLELYVTPGSSFGGTYYTVPYNILNLDGDLLPSSANTFSLGNQNQYWRNLYVGPGTITLQNEKQEEGYIGLNDNGIIYTDHGFASPFVNIGPTQTDVVGKIGGWKLYTEEDVSLNSIKLLAQANKIDGSYGTTGPIYTLIPTSSGPKGDTGAGVTGSTGINGGEVVFGVTKIIYGTYTTLNNTPTGTIYFNHSFTSSISYSLTLTMLDPSVTDNSISITQKGTTFAGYHMQKGAVGHQVNWIAIGY